MHSLLDYVDVYMVYCSCDLLYLNKHFILYLVHIDFRLKKLLLNVMSFVLFRPSLLQLQLSAIHSIFGQTALMLGIPLIYVHSLSLKSFSTHCFTC